MRQSSLIPLAILIIVGGCGDSDPMSSVQEVDVVPAVTKPTLTPPEQSGPIVVRYEGSYGIAWGDPEQNLSLWVNFDPIDICNGVFDTEPLDFQVISVPEDLDRLIVNGRGYELSASLWPTSFLLGPPGRCDLYMGLEPIAMGTVNLQYSDNDLLGTTDPNTNTYGRTVEGTLKTPDGESLHVNAVTRFIVHPDGDTLVLLGLVVTP